MIVHKCEKCKAELVEYERIIQIGQGYRTKELCIRCGKKLLSKLGQKEIIKSK